MIRILIFFTLFFSAAIWATIGPFENYFFPSRLPCSKSNWTQSFQLFGAAGYNDIQLKPAKGKLDSQKWNRLLRGDSILARKACLIQCNEEVREYEVWICSTNINRCDMAEPRHIGNTLVYFEEPVYPLGIESSSYSALTAPEEKQPTTTLEAFSNKSKVILSFLAEDIDFNDRSINKIAGNYLSQLYSYVYIYKKWPHNFNINQFVSLIFSKSLAQHFPIVVNLIEFITTPLVKQSDISVETPTHSPSRGLTPRKEAAIAAAIEIEGSDNGLIRRCVHGRDDPPCQEYIRKWGIEMQTRRNFVFRKNSTGRDDFTPKEMADLLVVAKYMYNTISSDLNLYRSLYPNLPQTKDEENSKCDPLIAKGIYETGKIFDSKTMQEKPDPGISPTLLRYCRFRHFLELTSFIPSISLLTKEPLNTFRQSLPSVQFLIRISRWLPTYHAKSFFP